MTMFLFFFVNLVLQILSWAIIIRVLLSWLPMAGIQIDPYNPIFRLLYSVTDPILEPLRRYTTVGMIDLSPIVAIILINVVRSILLSFLSGGL
jgi:YggT family protein